MTLEPCSHQGKSPPCADAIIRAGIARVVSAMEDPNPEVAGQGHARLREKGIAVEVGLGDEEARRAHIGHITRITKGRPHVHAQARALRRRQGRACPAASRWRSPAKRRASRVFQMRAQSDAILVGIGTVLADNPHLTCRLPGMNERSPVRVVLDSQLRLPLSTSVVATVRETPTWVITSGNPSAIAEDILQQKGAQVFRVGERNGQLDLDEVLKVLAEQGITRLMVEGGPKVAASLVAADLVDEAVLIRADKSDRRRHRCARRACRSTALTNSCRRAAASSSAPTHRNLRARLMFTGIVTDIGEVRSVKPRADDLTRITIACGYPRAELVEGTSMACAGVCMTIVGAGEEDGRAWFAVDAAAETLRVTNVGRWRHGSKVNLERPLKIGDELGGHLVSGHVDGLATLDGARGPDRHGAA